VPPEARRSEADLWDEISTLLECLDVAIEQKDIVAQDRIRACVADRIDVIDTLRSATTRPS
jgi:hypothetical protein